MAFYEETPWGIFYASCLFFPLIPPLFYASGHSHLVQQMSSDVPLLQCVTGVVRICTACVCFAVFEARHTDYEFHCRFPLHSSIVDKFVLSPSHLGHVWEGDGACLWILLKGSSTFPPFFFEVFPFCFPLSIKWCTGRFCYFFLSNFLNLGNCRSV